MEQKRKKINNNFLIILIRTNMVIKKGALEKRKNKYQQEYVNMKKKGAKRPLNLLIQILLKTYI